MFSDDKIIVVAIGYVKLSHLPFISVSQIAGFIEGMVYRITIIEGGTHTDKAFFLPLNVVGKFGEKSERNLYITSVSFFLAVNEVHLIFRKLYLASNLFGIFHISQSGIVDIKELPFGHQRVDQVLAASVLFSKVLFVSVEDLCKLLFGFSILGSILEEPLGLIDSLSVGHHVG